MKLSKEEFKKLQQDWYERLKEDGFKDIEAFKDNNTELISDASSRRGRMPEQKQLLSQAREEYYDLLCEMIQNENTIFRNAIDQYILLRYLEGAKLIDISQELAGYGMRRERKSIRFIIRRYEMEWKIKFYTRTQLNKKK